MQIVVEVIGVWIFLSLVLGPLFAWAFFYPERRAQAIQAARDRWIATHPTTPFELMPAWLGWEDASGGHVQDELADPAPGRGKASLRKRSRTKNHQDMGRSRGA